MSEKFRWLPTLPSGWRVVPLRHVADVSTGSADTQDAAVNGEYPFVVRSSELQRIDTYTHEGEAVLTPGDGDVGQVFHHLNGRFAAHQRVYVLSRFREVSGRFFYYYFSSTFSHATDAGTAKSTVESLRRPMITAFPVAVPPFLAQKQIAEYLDRETAKIDALIAKQKVLVASLLERRAALIADAVDSPYDGRRLKHFVKSIRQGWSPECEQMPADGVTEWGILKSGCMNGGSFRWQENKRLPEDVMPRPDAVVRQGEIVLSRASTRELVGSAAVVDRSYPRLLLSDLVYAVEVDSGVAVPEYLSLILGTPRVRGLIQAAAKGTSSSMQKVSQSDLMGLPMSVPSPSEQRRRLDEVRTQTTRLDQLVAMNDNLRNLLRERRRALIMATVTGQLDVATYGRPESAASVTT